MGRLTCSSNFICYKSEFGDLKKKVKDTSLSDCLECIQGEQVWCNFQISYGDGYFCFYPLALYVVKNRLWD